MAPLSYAGDESQLHEMGDAESNYRRVGNPACRAAAFPSSGLVFPDQNAQTITCDTQIPRAGHNTRLRWTGGAISAPSRIVMVQHEERIQSKAWNKLRARFIDQAVTSSIRKDLRLRSCC